ncbi:class I SAM-dependent methyltransferase [Aquisalibacillus elongatus]|uniref:Ubiquinone/menaquinone biosynthesis C-methylase UbiE n=1 Tax=Aquisalibacillus elongatus TaxID=485577 RepID=A0A3N5BSC8_9BACI|nr:class I SAM-dependent methyltransferase [Aquisalibacillus elongatus]RPF50402.1 ubiquinone/menaquinone biosynthesis C-methylase UbiE [Aquisalibacillus elongatus]
MAPLYDQIGLSYDTTRKADPEITRRLRYHLQVTDQSQVLDIACGTGNYTVALEHTGLNMFGVDQSKEMIKHAQEKSTTIHWELGDVSKLPFNNKVFNGVACTLAIHHFDNLLVPFQEVYRVLDCGRFVIFTSSHEQMKYYWLNEYFPDAIAESAQQMPNIKDVTETLGTAGFNIIGNETFLIQPDLEDFFLYSGKYDPNMYLNEKVRSGISTFANLASEEEVEIGIEKLRKDIESKRIEEVLTKYTSQLGDYTFVVAEKR